MPINPMADDLGSSFFKSTPGFDTKPKRRRRSIPERDDSDKKPKEKPVSFEDKDREYYQMISIWGKPESERSRRGGKR